MRIIAGHELDPGIHGGDERNIARQPVQFGNHESFVFQRVMTNSSVRTTRQPTGAPLEPPERPAVVHSSLYLPEPVYEALRKVAFDERVKIHDLVMEGIDAMLRRRGHASLESRKAGKKR